MSQGTVVDATSGALHYSDSYRSDVRDMFGGTYAPLGAGVTLFKDYNSPYYQGGSVQPGYVHFVEWHTPDAVTLRSFMLHAQNEGMNRRAFNRFKLLWGDGAGNWTTIYDTGPGFSYYLHVYLESNVAPVEAKFFRAEFTQAPWTDSRAIGPRVFELDGFDTFLPGTVPEPTALAVWGLLGACGAGLAARRRRHAGPSHATPTSPVARRR
ncbi:MAG: PEP-CTERM sorting domain-containing protein [Planctomycetaceae bacterium]|nr:PEP-CTERM sorting domain-containing protein [Planctomycetaceae bacterium]